MMMMMIMMIIIIIIITPWSRVLSKKLIRPQLVRKLPALPGIRRFTTVFRKTRYLSLPWVRSILSTLA
jgi:hypothetical protein